MLTVSNVMCSYLVITFSLVILSSTSVYGQDIRTTRKPLNLNSCTNDDNCTLNAYCYFGRCVCKTGFLPYRETKKSPVKCIKEASDLEDYCEKDVQCQAAFGTHAYCRYIDSTNLIGKCYCQANAHYIHGLCYKTSYIGDACEVNDNCLIKSKHLQAFCDYSRCICPPKHHPTDDGTDCYPTSELGGPCANNAGCITLFSECRRGVCECKREYMPNYDNNTCLQVAKRLGDPCDEDGQCLVAHQFTHCDPTYAVCRCQEGAHEMDGTCWKSAKLLEPCGDTNECRSNPHRDFGVECSHGICQCKAGYELEDNKECIMWDPQTRGRANVSMRPAGLLMLLGMAILSLK